MNETELLSTALAEYVPHTRILGLFVSKLFRDVSKKRLLAVETDVMAIITSKSLTFKQKKRWFMKYPGELDVKVDRDAVEREILKHSLSVGDFRLFHAYCILPLGRLSYSHNVEIDVFATRIMYREHCGQERSEFLRGVDWGATIASFQWVLRMDGSFDYTYDVIIELLDLGMEKEAGDLYAFLVECMYGKDGICFNDMMRPKGLPMEQTILYRLAEGKGLVCVNHPTESETYIRNLEGGDWMARRELAMWRDSL